MTYREFMHWISFLKIEMEKTEKIEIYLARLTGLLGAKGEFKISDYLLNFNNKKSETSIKIDGKQMAEIFKGYLGIKDK